MGQESDPGTNDFIMPFSRAVRFHGHICPGLAVGYYASHIGMRWAHGQRAQGCEIVAISESAGCGVDAIQAVTGCTIGKGNLIVRDNGKQVFTFLIKQTGEGLRISLKPEFLADRLDHGLTSLRESVSDKEAAAEKTIDLSRHIELVCRTILESPGDMVFDIRSVSELPPTDPPKSGVVICAGCGEPVSLDRAKKVGDQYLCQPCQSLV